MDMNVTVDEMIRFVRSFGKPGEMSGFKGKKYYHLVFKIEDPIYSFSDLYEVEDNIKKWCIVNNFEELKDDFTDHLDETYVCRDFDKELMKKFCEIKISFRTRRYDELMGKHSPTNPKSITGELINSHPRSIDVYVYDQWR